MTETPPRLSQFIAGMNGILASSADEATILNEGGALLAQLVAQDDWLDEAYAQPDPQRYRQYLLHRDPQARFSVVSFVWGPGQATPIHNHTVWGLVGVLRGSERSQPYALTGEGISPAGPASRLEPGQVEAVSPRIGDIHKVTNDEPGQVSISIHVYGADIGEVRRSTFDLDGRAKPFISGYSNA